MKDSRDLLCNIANVLGKLAGIAFLVTLLLLPMRLRIELLPRPNPPIHRGYVDFLLFAPDVAMLATLVFWGGSLLAARRRILLGPAYVWLPLSGVLLAGVVSIVSSVDRALSLYHAVRLTALFAFFLYIVNEFAPPALIAFTVAVQGVAQAIVAVAQFLAQHSIGLQALGESVLDPAHKGVSIVSTGPDRILRAYGLTDHPNILGGCLAFGLVLLLAVYLWAEWDKRFMVLVAFLPMTLGLFLTFSRSAWLAFLVGAAFLVGIQMALRRWALLRPLLWLILADAILLAPFVWRNANLLSIRLGVNGPLNTVPAEVQSVGARVLLMVDGSHIFLGHILTGIGLGASPIAMRNEYPELTIDYQPPHLTLLDSALETGAIGGAFYCLLLILPWVALLRRRDLLVRPQVAGSAALLLAVTIVGFFDYYTWLLVPGRLLQWVSWGLLSASLRKSELTHLN